MIFFKIKYMVNIFVNGLGVFEKLEERREGRKQEREGGKKESMSCIWGSLSGMLLRFIVTICTFCLPKFSIKVSHYGTRFVHFLFLEALPS